MLCEKGPQSNSATIYLDPATTNNYLRYLLPNPNVTNPSGSGQGPNSGNAAEAVSRISSGSGSGSGVGIGGSDEIAKTMLGFDLDLVKIQEVILGKLVSSLDYLFEPVTVNFSNELLANQIQNISVLLFLLTVFLSILFISLLFNLTAYLFSGKLMSYFKNKYILRYLSINKKVIVFEIITVSGLIIYLLYTLLFGLQYIASHPIIF
jgi:hypothetical protein